MGKSFEKKTFIWKIEENVEEHETGYLEDWIVRMAGGWKYFLVEPHDGLILMTMGLPLLLSQP